MKIGNIVYRDGLVTHEKVDFVNYINEPVPFSEISNNLPTLYVGWDWMKKINNTNEMILNADILKKKIKTGELYWEFEFTEHKSSHVNGVNRFIKYLPDIYFKTRYKYVNIDPVFFQIRDVDDLYPILPKDIKNTYIYKNEILYILSKNNTIFGVNLKTYKFFNFPIDDMVQHIISCSDEYFNDSDAEIFVKNNKIFPNFKLLRRYLVVILSK